MLLFTHSPTHPIWLVTKALFGKDGDQVSQVKDQVGQGQVH